MGYGLSQEGGPLRDLLGRWEMHRVRGAHSVRSAMGELCPFGCDDAHARVIGEGGMGEALPGL